MLITRVGVILTEPTEFPLALKGQARTFYQLRLVVRSTSTKDRVGVILMEPTEYPLALKGQARNQRLDTSMLQNVSIHRDMDILMSNSIDSLTGTNLQRLGYARGKQYEIISQCLQFFQLFFG